MIDTGSLFVAVCLYLGLLLAITRFCSANPKYQHWLQHPTVVILALGIYANATGLVISLDLAYKYGFGFLAYYLGATGAFLLAPVLLYPLFKIANTYQLFSLPDMLAFRYRSQTAGSAATIVSFIGLMIILAVQARVFANSIELISGYPLGPGGAGTLIVAALLVVLLSKAQHQTPGQSDASMILLLCLQSSVKLAIMLGVGLLLVFGQFGGFDGLDQWIEINGQRISALDRQLGEDPWRALLLLFFSSALLFPPLFHLLFSENRRSNTLFKASWGFPAYLLLISLPIPVIVWSGIKMAVPTAPEYFFIGIGLSLDSYLWVMVTSVSSIASGILLFALGSISLSGMCINHLILPVMQPRSGSDIYRWLSNYRKLVILLVITCPWILFMQTPSKIGSADLIIIGFSLLVQLLPGILSLVNWPQGNHNGFIVGLLLGSLSWFFTLYLPWLHQADPLFALGLLAKSLEPETEWHFYLLVSLTVNTIAFVGLSMLTKARPEELATARACSVDTLLETRHKDTTILSTTELVDRLTAALGPKAASKEVLLAISHLGLSNTEQRPLALKRIRKQIEVNLSGLLGPTMAQSIIRRYLDQANPKNDQSSDIYFVESRLEDYHSRLSGLAAELDQLRRYHRQILQQLPIATCSLGEQKEVLTWNHAMETLTALREDEIVGGHVAVLPEPWSEILLEFSAATASRIPKKRVLLDGRPHWFNLHKAALDPAPESGKGQVILIEDCTETQLLEEELIHSERLASVGRLAAGVAHEIGNPITGIACLSQNLKWMTSDPEILDTSRQILDQTQRISRILQTLMNFARRGNHTQQVYRVNVNIKHCVEEAIHLLKLAPDAIQVAFFNEVPEDCTVTGDDQRLVQVFVNLLSNARDASSTDGKILIKALQKHQSVEIYIIDEGCGIPEAQKDRLFEPFFTTKGPDKGTGLGLALVYGIIDEHFGHIRLESPVSGTNKGTQVIIELPLQQTKSI
jgi:PAS domain S-box-containing protein